METNNQTQLLVLVEKLVMLEDRHRETEYVIIVPIPLMIVILILFVSHQGRN
jgi:hypothetical protein